MNEQVQANYDLHIKSLKYYHSVKIEWTINKKKKCL